jgi:hypothetical protein
VIKTPGKANMVCRGLIEFENIVEKAKKSRPAAIIPLDRLCVIFSSLD